ncbi:MAG: PSD1 and planctomycete cytochrome C domain-containing protein [Pirellulales bacterium]
MATCGRADDPAVRPTGTAPNETRAATAALVDDAKPFDTDAIEFFEAKVRPLLVEHCHKCHSTSSDKPEGGLLLDAREQLLTGGDTGPAIVPGRPDESLLIDAVRYGDIYQMPPDSKLPDEAIATFETWVASGAAWTPDELVSAAPIKQTSGIDVAQRRREHWAWQPIAASTPPAVHDTAWPKLPLDQFVLARLEAAGLHPAAAAERRVLVRRLYFDLIGLPPTPAQVEAFVSDTTDEAVPRVVDSLLSSPHFGERWARHWLDLVRYAESRGHEQDTNSANAYQYRDYVVRALNADVPYDEFVREHVAGDLIDPPRRHPDQGYNESVLGTGFWFLGEWVHSPVDVRKDETDRFDNMVDVFSKTFLGLTVSCARCHAHKFDAITQRDYYALEGFLQSSAYRQIRFESLDHNQQIARKLDELDRQYKPQIIDRAVAARRASVEQSADYLTAALAVDGGAPLDDAADTSQLDVARLQAWRDEFRRAAADAKHPLHGWIAAAQTAGGESPGIEMPEIELPGVASPGVAWQVVADYTNVRRQPVDWRANGVVFGTGPNLPGDVMLGHDVSRPIERVVVHGSVRRDPLWNGLVEAAGTENDQTRMADWLAPSHTFRTPTFDVAASHVFYLVRGSGHAYAVVDSHRVNRGPLHGELVQSWTSDGKDGSTDDAWRWVGHDLTRYLGRNAHVEFTTEADAPMEVALVVLADTPPTTTLEQIDPTTLSPPIGAGTARDIAGAVQQRIVEAVDALAAGTVADGDASAAQAALADWVLRSEALFPPSDDDAAAALLSEYWQKHDELDTQIMTESHAAMAMWDGTGRDEELLVRGNARTPAGRVPRRFLEAIAGDEPMPVAQGSGRLELAAEMTDPATNPFVPRVIVNRVWQHLFGVGLVPSVDNFGVLGIPPTHPELLDHLADEFVQDGWSLKRLIRQLVLSSSYQMSSAVDPAAVVVDPANTLLHHARVRRLEGEVIRDAMLAISGRLDESMFGQSIPVHLTEYMKARGLPETSGPLDGAGRRSIYIAVRRNFIAPMMLAFDTPIPFTTIGRRNSSNVPSQALILLNDPLVAQQAALWGQRAVTQGPADPAARIDWMYETAFARPASAAERSAAVEFLQMQAVAQGRTTDAWSDDPQVWGDLAHVLFNVKEFVFVP